MFKRFIYIIIVLFTPALTWSATLTDVQFSALPADGMEMVFQFDEPIKKPSSYKIDKPARISLDFPGAELATKKFINLGGGNARSIVLAKGQNKLRAIINMQYIQDYNVSAKGSSVIVRLKSLQVGSLASVKEDNSNYTFSDTSVSSSSNNTIKNIEFQRGVQGAGKVVIGLSSGSAPINISQQGSRIDVRFDKSVLPTHLQKQFDVTDFGTPIRTFSAKQEGQEVRLIIKPVGEYDYLAYQSGDEYTISVRQLTQQEVLQKQLNTKPIYEGDKITLNFQEIPVREVLQIIADLNNVNLVVSQSVSDEPISLRLDNVPWDQALDLILKTANLDTVQEGNIMFVAPAEELASRKAEELETKEKIKSLEPLKTEFFQVNYTAASDVKLLLSKEAGLVSERGAAISDDRTNTLIVTDTEEKLQSIRDLIERIDISVKQVLIEARLVFATDSFSEALGVRWGITDVLHNNKLSLESVSADFAVAGATNIALGISDLASGLLDVEISAQASEGQAEVIATPKVLTADNQAAKIASGSRVPFQSIDAQGNPKTEFFDAVLELDVTPQIAPDGNILLKLKVSNNSVNDFGAAGLGLNINEVDTNVLVKDGQTVVLGGVYQTEKTSSQSKMPLLGDIPLVGGLFKNDSENTIKRELLIFITPKLVQKNSFN